jgi:hypothetical protein
MISGPSGFKKILGLSTEVGAVFNVFESDLSSIVVEGSISDDILQLFQDTLVLLEETIDAKFGTGKFVDEFKRGLASNANKYLFLDPFAGEFVYKDKTLAFEGEDTSLEEFTTGVCDVINQTVEHFTEKEENIVDLICVAMQPLKEERIQLIDRLQLDKKMPSVFGDRAFPEAGQKEEDEKEAKGGRFTKFFKRKKSSEEA